MPSNELVFHLLDSIGGDLPTDMFRSALVAGSLGVLGKADGRFCCPPCRGWAGASKVENINGMRMYQVYPGPGMRFP